jgi:hypothetical protein
MSSEIQRFLRIFHRRNINGPDDAVSIDFDEYAKTAKPDVARGRQ